MPHQNQYKEIELLSVCYQHPSSWLLETHQGQLPSVFPNEATCTFYLQCANRSRDPRMMSLCFMSVGFHGGSSRSSVSLSASSYSSSKSSSRLLPSTNSHLSIAGTLLHCLDFIPHSLDELILNVVGGFLGFSWSIRHRMELVWVAFVASSLFSFLWQIIVRLWKISQICKSCMLQRHIWE